ncbi:hypothetical protein JHW43_004021 [Diplocarpon mali]|nr:hypothetical protein JHW43_004021 [Diplocarpon mali]
MACEPAGVIGAAKLPSESWAEVRRAGLSDLRSVRLGVETTVLGAVCVRAPASSEVERGVILCSRTFPLETCRSEPYGELHLSYTYESRGCGDGGLGWGLNVSVPTVRTGGAGDRRSSRVCALRLSSGQLVSVAGASRNHTQYTEQSRLVLEGFRLNRTNSGSKLASTLQENTMPLPELDTNSGES